MLLDRFLFDSNSSAYKYYENRLLEEEKTLLHTDNADTSLAGGFFKPTSVYQILSEWLCNDIFLSLIQTEESHIVPKHQACLKGVIHMILII